MQEDNEKLYEIQSLLYNGNAALDFIKVTQISEVALKPGGRIPEHAQICKEISYVISGEGFFYTNDKVMHVSRGDIHVVTEGVRHEVIAGPYERMRYVCLGFDFTKIPSQMKELEAFYAGSPDSPMRSEGDIRYLFDMLINEIYAEAAIKDNAVENIIKLILIKVMQCFERGREKPVGDKGKEHGNATVYKIAKYIDHNIYNVRSVREIATALCFTENYISHVFKTNMGISLTAYIKRRKLEAAGQLIKSGGMSVTEIASVLNFDSVQSLSRAFKREYGITPSRYGAKEHKSK